MNVRTNYIINEKTSVIHSYYYNKAEYSKVFEGMKTYLVARPPREIVKESFNHIGYSLDEAKRATRFILKRKYNIPVIFSGLQNIMIILCHTTDKENTTYLINSHILDIQPDDESGQIIVHLSGGRTFFIDIKINLLQDSRNQATFLHKFLLENAEMNRSLFLLNERDKGMMLVKEKQMVSYNFTKKRKK